MIAVIPYRYMSAAPGNWLFFVTSALAADSGMLVSLT